MAAIELPGGAGVAGCPTDVKRAARPRKDAGPQSVFRHSDYVRLWAAQVVSSLGDWIGIVAVIAIASRIAGNDRELATSLVMVARVLPGFLFAPLAGVLVDRWDRRRTMIVCDICRGLLLTTLPFVGSVAMLFVVSFALEIFAMLWQPSKESLVPALVEPRQLAQANSLGLGAAYATFPVGAIIFTALAYVASFIAIDGIGQEALAIWVDCLTFFASAVLIFRLHVPEVARTNARPKLDLRQTWRELREGWSYIAVHPVVRVVVLGLAIALLGGASVIPLGAAYAKDVIHGGPGGTTYGLVLTALGTGAALGVGGILLWTHRRTHSMVHCFTLGLVLAGASLFAVASVDTVAAGLVFILTFGMGAGGAYITGFTALGETVQDDLRGRVFASLFTIIRFCLLLAVTVAPLLAGAFGSLARLFVPSGHFHVGLSVDLSGTRLIFWMGGLIVMTTGLWARRAYARSLERTGL